MNCEINDIREPSNFRGISFSSFKKTDVRKQFFENMKQRRIEQACYWGAELLCSGHFIDLWDNILHYFGKHIHLGNPKIAMYLDRRYQIFQSVMSQGKFINELQIRNNPTIRKMFAEVITVLSLSNQKNSFEPVKIKRTEEFDITQMSEKLIAPSISYAEPIMKEDDPNEFFIAANEFAYNISMDKRNMLNACYWIEWTIEFDALCKKRKIPCKCETRKFIKVDPKFRNDIIWILWDTLLYYAELKNNTFISELMNATLSLFTIKYTTAVCKRRRYLIYYAVSLLTEHIEPNIELISNKKTVQNVISKIDIVYKQIKKNEESPNTDYLFANLEKQNTLEQSIRKMELVNSMSFSS